MRYWPSILQQTKWRCSFFDFGKAQSKEYTYFNCGLVDRPDGLWLIARRSKNEKRIRIGFNDMVAVRLAEDTYLPQYMVPIVTQHFFSREHFEDPRAIYHKGTTYVAACNFLIVDPYGLHWTGAHQTLSLVPTVAEKKNWPVVRRIDPVYGYNGATIEAKKGAEKNWLWFFHEDRLHMLYSAQPHVVTRWTNDFKVEYEYRTGEPEKPLPWAYGIMRGGTPPIRISDDEYLTFFHSSLDTKDKYHRRYYMGAYTFKAQPPFNVTRITTEPLLVGSWQDVWAERKPLVVFPCGSRLKDDKWLVTMGINDLACAWIEIPHAELEPLLQPVDQPEKPDNRFTLLTNRLQLPQVTLVLADDRRPDLAQKALAVCTSKIKFGDVKFFNSKGDQRHAVKVAPITNLHEYCRFILKDLYRYVETSHVLVAQWDGYVIDEKKWDNKWLEYDYIGALWPNGQMGNGGFSLRSKKLLAALQSPQFGEPFNPEDEQICRAWRPVLEKDYGIKFAPPAVAEQFSVENQPYKGQFGFHSFSTPVPKDTVPRPYVFAHAGDWGDMIYSLATVKAIGGGLFFIAPKDGLDLRQIPTKENAQNILPLLRIQDYIIDANFYGDQMKLPDYDLNNFRIEYRRGVSLFQQHLDAFGVFYEPDRAWLKVDKEVAIPQRPIVVNRSHRYRNLNFPWAEIVDRAAARMVFVGTKLEHEEFCKLFGFVPFYETPTLLHAARVIAGAKLFIGNQSAIMALALGLNRRVIQETWAGDRVELGDLKRPWDGHGDPNCRIPRKNAAYVVTPDQVPWDWLTA